MKNLKKKQKELNKKHPPDSAQGHTPSIATEDEEDSDLASIARELKDEAADDDSDDIFDSPFIKKPVNTRVRHMSDNTTPLPEKEFSFISSTSHKQQEEEPDRSPEKSKQETKKASKALDQFVKFDQKYSNFKALKKIESSEVSDESEPIMSPVKMMIQTPSPKGSSRLRRQAEQAGLTMLTIPSSTVSEISDHYPSPRSPRTPKSPNSPIFSLANLHDIEELIMDEITTNEKDTKKTLDVKDNYFNFASPSKKVEPEPTDVIEEDDEVLVTEDDVDEELIEIELSEEKSETSVIEQEKEKEQAKPEAQPVPIVPLLEFEEDQPTSESVATVEKVEKKPSKKDKKSHEKRHKKRRSRRAKSCYYCDHVSSFVYIPFKRRENSKFQLFLQVCDFHMDKIKPAKEANNVKSESVQVGQPNVKYGRGHYMFDPSLDVMTDFPGSLSNNDYLAFLRSAWTGHDISSHHSVQKEAQKVLASE